MITLENIVVTVYYEEITPVDTLLPLTNKNILKKDTLMRLFF